MHRSLSDHPAVGTIFFGGHLYILTYPRSKMVRLPWMPCWDRIPPSPQAIWNGIPSLFTYFRHLKLTSSRHSFVKNARKHFARTPENSRKQTSIVPTAITNLYSTPKHLNLFWSSRARIQGSIIVCWRMNGFVGRSKGLSLMLTRHPINWVEELLRRQYWI